MDLDNKLKGMPKVYYFNLDNRTDRRKYMERQLTKWDIEHVRLSGTKYLGSKIDEWNHLIVDFDEYTLLPAIAANAISHLEFLKNWYTETDEPHLILMEDDYDLSVISRWHFDWNYLMERLPYDWDCLHMGYENPEGLPIFGCMVSFKCESIEKRDSFLSKLKLFTLAESLGGVESLVSVPYEMTHAAVPEDSKESMGLTKDLVRLSIGIEHLDDLYGDIISSLE